MKKFKEKRQEVYTFLLNYYKDIEITAGKVDFMPMIKANNTLKEMEKIDLDLFHELIRKRKGFYINGEYINR